MIYVMIFAVRLFLFKYISNIKMILSWFAKGDIVVPIWKLEPKNLTDHNWKARRYEDVVIVRAPNYKEALREARLKLKKMAGLESRSEDTSNPPWECPKLVVCTRLEKSEYDEDGPTQILYSTGYD